MMIYKNKIAPCYRESWINALGPPRNGTIPPSCGKHVYYIKDKHGHLSRLSVSFPDSCTRCVPVTQSKSYLYVLKITVVGKNVFKRIFFFVSSKKKK